jgi:hypothetical protein
MTTHYPELEAAEESAATAMTEQYNITHIIGTAPTREAAVSIILHYMGEIEGLYVEVNATATEATVRDRLFAEPDTVAIIYEATDTALTSSTSRKRGHVQIFPYGCSCTAIAPKQGQMQAMEE